MIKKGVPFQVVLSVLADNLLASPRVTKAISGGLWPCSAAF
jgi:hypothetical protein